MDQLKLAPHSLQVNMLAARWLPLMWFNSDALLAKHALQMWQNSLPEISDLSAIVRARLASIPRWLVAPVVPAAANCQHGQYTERDVTDGTKATGTQMLLTNTAKLPDSQNSTWWLSQWNHYTTLLGFVVLNTLNGKRLISRHSCNKSSTHNVPSTHWWRHLLSVSTMKLNGMCHWCWIGFKTEIKKQWLPENHAKWNLSL